MAKRILTFDYLRGFAMIMICVFHIILTGWDIAIQIRDGAINPFDLPVFYIILMVTVLIFGYWRGFFLIISSVVHIYGMSVAIRKGADRNKILLKQILTGVILLIWGSFVEVFFNEWGLMARWAAGSGFEPNISAIYNAEALVNIGWAIIISGIIYFFLTAGNGVDKTHRNAVIFALLSLIIILITPLVHNWANQIFGANMQSWSSVGSAEGYDQFSFGLLFTCWFVGVESPTLPALAYSFAGCVVGIYLGSKKVGKKTLKYGYLFSFIVFSIGAILSALKIMDTLGNGGDIVATLDVHVHPTWFLILMLGMQLIAVMICLNLIEFNKKVNLSKAAKFTKPLRRWGILSLTVYSFAVIQYFVRFVLNPLTSQNLLEQGGANFIWVIIIIAADLLLWTGILFGWEKIGFKGSLEWVMLKLGKPGKKSNKKDPLNVEGTLYDVEPILFVKPEREQDIKFFYAGSK